VEEAKSRSSPFPSPCAYLDIKPADFVRAGVFEGGAEGDRNIQAGGPKVGFVEGDQVYLVLRKEIRRAAARRLPGPGRSIVRETSGSGYVSYLIG